ncbi:MAG: rod shape-determining protein MreD [Deltaproteobacteria bacterium]|nr:MAG: rod shape-determining protein MreD [Deltaproteobacteria bacterium]
MYPFFFFLFIGVVFVFFQSNLFLHKYIFPLKFDLTIPLIVYLSISQKPVSGGILSLWFGFLIDAFSGGVMGLYTFLREFMFFLAQILKKFFFLKNKLIFAFLVFLLFLMEAFILFFTFRVSAGKFMELKRLIPFCFTRAGFSLFVWIIIYRFLFKY